MMEYKSKYSVRIYNLFAGFEIVCSAYDEDSARDYAIGYAMEFLPLDYIERIEVTPIVEMTVYTGQDCMPTRGKDYKVKQMPLVVKDLY